jgi:hypothetical protein
MNFVPNRLIAYLLSFLLASNIIAVPEARAQIRLPSPGQMVALSKPAKRLVLSGIKVFANKPMSLDFVVDGGGNSEADSQEINRLIRYFMAGLTVPEGDLWVNLSPYEKDRIVPEAFGQTDMGRDLLAQDYILKQITASVIYPDSETGKAFWSKVYAQAQKQFGTHQVPVNTFNKVWIVPNIAEIFEGPVKNGQATAYVTKATLKVMLEEDYLAFNKNKVAPAVWPNAAKQNAGVSQVVREIVLPQLEREINEGANFSHLRQIYHSLILATWYKTKIKDGILFSQYNNQQKVSGITIKDPQDKEKIYQQYLEAFKKGAFNFIREEQDPATGQTIPRKYFSGGAKMDIHLSSAMKAPKNPDYAQMAHVDFTQDHAQVVQAILLDLVSMLFHEINDELELLDEQAAIRQLKPLFQRWNRKSQTSPGIIRINRLGQIFMNISREPYSGKNDHGALFKGGRFKRSARREWFCLEWELKEGKLDRIVIHNAPFGISTQTMSRFLGRSAGKFDTQEIKGEMVRILDLFQKAAEASGMNSESIKISMSLDSQEGVIETNLQDAILAVSDADRAQIAHTNFSPENPISLDEQAQEILNSPGLQILSYIDELKEFLILNHAIKREAFGRVMQLSDDEVLKEIDRILKLESGHPQKGLDIHDTAVDLRELYFRPTEGEDDLWQAISAPVIFNVNPESIKKFGMDQKPFIREQAYLVVRGLFILINGDHLLFKEEDSNSNSSYFTYLIHKCLDHEGNVSPENAARFVVFAHLLNDLLAENGPKPKIVASIQNYLKIVESLKNNEKWNKALQPYQPIFSNLDRAMSSDIPQIPIIHTMTTSGFEAIRKRLLELNIDPSTFKGRVLYEGYGYGWDLKGLARILPEADIVGVEWDMKGSSYAQRLVNVSSEKVLFRDLFNTQLDNDSFDLVIISDRAKEYAKSQARLQDAQAEALRLVKPQAVILELNRIDDFNWDIEVVKQTDRAMTVDEIKAAAQELAHSLGFLHIYSVPKEVILNDELGQVALEQALKEDNVLGVTEEELRYFQHELEAKYHLNPMHRTTLEGLLWRPTRDGYDMYTIIKKLLTYNTQVLINKERTKRKAKELKESRETDPAKINAKVREDMIEEAYFMSLLWRSVAELTDGKHLLFTESDSNPNSKNFKYLLSGKCVLTGTKKKMIKNVSADPEEPSVVESPDPKPGEFLAPGILKNFLSNAKLLMAIKSNHKNHIASIKNYLNLVDALKSYDPNGPWARAFEEEENGLIKEYEEDFKTLHVLANTSDSAMTVSPLLLNPWVRNFLTRFTPYRNVQLLFQNRADILREVMAMSDEDIVALDKRLGIDPRRYYLEFSRMQGDDLTNTFVDINLYASAYPLEKVIERQVEDWFKEQVSKQTQEATKQEVLKRGIAGSRKSEKYLKELSDLHKEIRKGVEDALRKELPKLRKDLFIKANVRLRLIFMFARRVDMFSKELFKPEDSLEQSPYLQYLLKKQHFTAPGGYQSNYFTSATELFENFYGSAVVLLKEFTEGKTFNTRNKFMEMVKDKNYRLQKADTIKCIHNYIGIVQRLESDDDWNRALGEKAKGYPRGLNPVDLLKDIISFSDEAMSAVGGIDLNDTQNAMSVSTNGFKFNPSALQDVHIIGLSPVVTGIESMKSLPEFLGL